MFSQSEDTLTVIIAVLCVCFGMYPEYQVRAPHLDTNSSL